MGLDGAHSWGSRGEYFQGHCAWRCHRGHRFIAMVVYRPSLEATCTAQPFTDVACIHWAAAWIAEAKKRGIAVGDSSGNFYPGNSVTRAQMASFLTRTF